MSFIYELITSFFLIAGLFFFAVGTVGLLRMPDLYTRLHATTKCDTLGAGLILFGVFLYHGASWLGLKILLIIFFIWLINPTSAHAIARASFNVHRFLRDEIPLLDHCEVEEND